MGYAVCITFDDETDAFVRHMWLCLARQNVPSPLHGSAYRPHVTLGVFEPANPADFVTRLTGFGKKCAPFSIIFSSVDCFRGKTTVIYAKVEPSQELRQLHEDTYRLLKDISTPSRDLYLSGSWIPHCTLAWKIHANQADELLKICRKFPLPFEGQASSLWVFDDRREMEINSMTFERQR